MNDRHERVIGVDPGTQVVGYAVLERGAAGLERIASGTIRAKRGAPLPVRLKVIYDALSEVIASWNPEVMAVEGLFFGKNVQSTIRLGEGRAVALLAAANVGIEVVEYAPRSVKKAVVGHGSAHKSQVARMVQASFGLEKRPQSDEADAMAIGMTYLNRPVFLNTQGTL